MKTGSKPMPTKPEPLSDEMIDEMFPYESILDAPISTELYNTHITKQRRAAKQIRDLLQPRLTALQKRVQELEREREQFKHLNREKGVWGLDVNWNVHYHESDLSSVMKPEDCLYVASDSIDMLQYIMKIKPQPPKTK